jgi:magnesium transporter
MIHYDEKNRELSIEQINLILGDKYIISLQERVGDIFQSIRDRIKLGTGRIRKMGSDYLAYALMDAIVDNYFITLEKIGEDIEELEAELIENATTETLRKLHRLKREIIVLRRSVWPIREIINRFQRTESKLVTDVIDIFLRDVYDHSIQIMEIIESSRDILSGMIDIYLSSISNRMNEVMKVLTIIATIFIPLTLVAGIYGMNFSFMPELNWVFGYPLILISMLIVGIIMLIYFRKKKWI